MEYYSASSFWPTYIGEKAPTLGKTYGIKARLLTLRVPQILILP